MKILVIRFSSLGDIAISLPIVNSASEKGHEIYYLTKKQFVPFIETMLPKINPIPWEGSYSDIIHIVKKENIDFVLDIHDNLRSSILKILLSFRKNQTQILTYNKNSISRRLMLYRKRKNWKKLNTVIKSYLQVFKKADASIEISYLDNLPQGEKFENRYIIFHSNAKHKTKQMSESRYQQLLEILLNKIDLNIVLIGDKVEHNLLDDVRITDLRGKTDLHELCVLISNSEAVFTTDSAPIHIASCFNKPVFAVFQSTVPEFGFIPFSRNYRIYESLETDCRPCSLHGLKSCPKGHFECSEKIDLDKIAEDISSFLKENDLS